MQMFVLLHYSVAVAGWWRCKLAAQFPGSWTQPDLKSELYLQKQNLSKYVKTSFCKVSLFYMEVYGTDSLLKPASSGH